MKKFVLKYIDFNKCYSFLWFIGLLWVASVALVGVKAIPQKPFQTIMNIIELCLTLYVYLGFVKFSLIQKKISFQKLIFAAMALSIIQSSIAIMATLVNSKEFSSIGGVPFAMECVLLFYAFKSVQNMKTIYFRKLSRLYLYLSFFAIPASVALLFGQHAMRTMPQILIRPFVILALVPAVLIVFIWFLKMRVFKQLSVQLD